MTSNGNTHPYSPKSPSITSSLHNLRRRWSSYSNPEDGGSENNATTEREIVEEIEEIKRYEDFTTID